MRRFGSGRVGFWTRHRRASYPCFCWMPTVTSPKIHGQNKSVSTAAKKPHSMASVWENSYGTTICKRRTHTSQLERLSTIHVHRCCAQHHDGDRLQLAAAPERRDHRFIQCVFQHQLTYGTHERRQDTNGTRTSLHRVPFSRRTGPLFWHG